MRLYVLGIFILKGMDNVHHNLLKQPPILIQLIAIFGVGLFLGILSLSIPPYFVVVGIAGIIYFVVAWAWPEIALLGILVYTSTIFDINALPTIPIGVGHLMVSDILLFVLIGTIFLKGIVKSTSFFIHTPLDMPLLAFYCTAILATAIGIYNSRVTFNESLGELRNVNLFLTFFIVTNLVRTNEQLRRLFNGLIFLAIFVALAMIVQYILGGAVKLLPGRIETVNTAGVATYGVTRILPPGQSLVLLGFVCLLVQWLFEDKSSRFMIYIIKLGIVGLAVLLTFNRNFWAAVALSLFLMSLTVSFRDKVKFAKIVFWIVFVGALAITPFLGVKEGKIGKLLDSITIRMSTLFNPDTVQEDSLLYRYIENEYAYPQIASHPLFGLGLGALFRPADRRLDFGPEAGDGSGYIHNGHLWLMLKTGLIGYLFFMCFLLFFVKRGFQNWKRIPDPFLRAMVLSFVAIIPGILLASSVNPVFKNTWWSPVIGIMVGLGEVIIRLNQDQIGNL